MAFFTPPPGYSPAKLGTYAVLGLVIAAMSSVAAFDRDTGIPEESTLAEAHGTVFALDKERYGRKFRLQGHADIFEVPSKSGGAGAVEAALRSAGGKEVSVRYDPHPRQPLFSSDRYLNVWQLTVDGKTVRTIEQSRAGWRSDNAVAFWVFCLSLASGFYLAILAVQARRLQPFK